MLDFGFDGFGEESPEEEDDDDDVWPESDVDSYVDYAAISGTANGNRVLLAATDDFVDAHLNIATWGPGVDKIDSRGGDPLVIAKDVCSSILTKRYRTVIIDDDLLNNGEARGAMGKDLRRFFDQGGTVILYAWVGFFDLSSVVNRVFGTRWEFGGFGRTTFSKMPASAVYPPTEVDSFSITCHVLRAPEDEIMWGTSEDSDHQSFRAAEHGFDKPGTGLGAVLLHRNSLGGRLAYFGDVDFEAPTLQLLQALWKSGAAPALAPAPAPGRPGDASEALRLKQQGNSQFQAGDLAKALSLYDEALRQLPEPAPEELREISIIHSNRAECFLRLGLSTEAWAAADVAVATDPENCKALFRRAKAAQLEGSLRAAAVDLETVVERDPGCRDAVKLLRDIRATPRAGKQKAEGPPPPVQAADAAQSILPGTAAAAGIAARDDGAPFQLPSTAAWAEGLSKSQRCEWLVDCYRMRVDDDYVWGGGNMHGLYACSGKVDILGDFLVFCRLAVLRKALPALLDWQAFLAKAATLLIYAFEKSDAQEKWGGENVFNAMAGGRSLRFTGELIYGTSVQSMEGHLDDTGVALQEEVDKAGRNLLKRPERFAEVGGLESWQRLQRDMPKPQAMF